MIRSAQLLCLVCTLNLPMLFGAGTNETAPRIFEPADVFQLEFAADPQISPDGEHIVYARTFMDIMTDRSCANLWIINFDGSDHRSVTSGIRHDGSPRWSPDGKKLLYVSSAEGSSQIYLRWMDSGQTAKLSNLTRSPSNISWSPDGNWIAFSLFVPKTAKNFASMPAKPEGAEWAKPAIYIDKLNYRADGAGYLEDGYSHLFLLSADGGTPRQLTSGDFNHGGPVSWTPDSKQLLFSANRHDDWEYNPLNSEIHQFDIISGELRTLTKRDGPDTGVVISPDGQKIAYIGFDDQLHGYNISKLYLMDRDGSNVRVLTEKFDRSVASAHWSADGKSLFFQFDDKGNTKIGHVDLDGNVETLTGNVGGLSLGRPYAGGSYSLAANGRLAFTLGRPDHPADVAVRHKNGTVKRLTHLNDDLFSYKELGTVEEIWYKSSFDQRAIQGWIVKPPGFDPAKKYPLILEIHGGPFANYGDRFTAECQLYAAAGYVVLYTNPRGSSSYGKEFGNLIHHNYPGEDFDDLMSGVDAVIAKGYVNKDQLFVTGGSGGGVLSAWIVGHTDRFKAAVVQKPVINWYSFVLTADGPQFFYKYWFPGFPWDHLEHYMQRSPLHHVGNVKTPTMLLTGESDYRTPISESEQFYSALKILKVDAALVRIPDASHGIAARPSNLITKVAHILAWFEKYRQKDIEE